MQCLQRSFCRTPGTIPCHCAAGAAHYAKAKYMSIGVVMYIRGAFALSSPPSLACSAPKGGSCWCHAAQSPACRSASQAHQATPPSRHTVSQARFGHSAAGVSQAAPCRAQHVLRYLPQTNTYRLSFDILEGGKHAMDAALLCNADACICQSVACQNVSMIFVPQGCGPGSRTVLTNKTTNMFSRLFILFVGCSYKWIC